VITRDPDNGSRNVGTYRMQVIDERTTFMHWQLHKTGARHWRRYMELKQRMPVTVALGGVASSTTCPEAAISLVNRSRLPPLAASIEAQKQQLDGSDERRPR